MNSRTLFLAEFFKIRKRTMTWVLALLLVGIVVLLYSILWSVSGQGSTFGDRGHHFTADELRQALFVQSSVPFSLQLVSTFGTLFAVILVAGAVASEYSWGTVRNATTIARSRLRLLGARLAVICVLVAAGTLLATLVGLTYGTVIMLTTGGADYSFLSATFVLHQVMSYWRTLFVLAPFVAFAFAGAVAGRSMLGGIGAGLGMAFLEPIISNLMRAGGEPWKDIPNYLPSANKQVIMLQNALPEVLKFGPGGDLEGPVVNSVPEATIILSVYVLVALTTAFLVFWRRDIRAGDG